MGQLLHANAASHLVSKAAPYGTNRDGHLTGHEIFLGNLVDPETGDEFISMGRSGGLDGAALTDDIESGAWASRRYEVGFSEPPNANWFLIAEFVSRLPPDRLP